MIRKAILATFVFALALVALPAIAGAHVEIAADGKVAADGTVKATLTVPNECVKSDTTSLALNFPTTPALTTATIEPIAGWTVQADKDTATGAVTKVTFTGTLTGSADQKFPMTLGTIPAGTDSVTFTALQNCTNGDVIRWVETAPPGGAEPENPKPVLDVSGKPAAPDTTTTKIAVTTTKKSSDSNTGVIVGIVIAAVVVLGGGAALVARSKKKS